MKAAEVALGVSYTNSEVSKDC